MGPDPIHSLREFKRQVSANHKANFFILAVRFIVYRVAWVFKTESVVISAFVASITESSFMVGLFPMASRIGKFLPQLFTANLIEPLPKRKHALLLLNIGVLVPWGIVASWCWLKPQNRFLFVWFFLFAYFSFWACAGSGDLAVRTIIGKVIRPNFRGRLLKIVGIYGGILTVLGSLGATYIMRGPGPLQFPYNYATLFSITFALFLCVFVCNLIIREPSYPLPVKRDKVAHYFKNAFSLFRTDRNFRKIVLVGWTYSLGAAMFPFYTVFAKQKLGISIKIIAYALFIQYAGVAIGNYLLGPLADRRGNRITLSWTSWLTALVPVVPLLVHRLVPMSVVGYAYLLTYFMIGISVGRETYLQNYLLEISPLERQPLFVGAANMFIALSSFFPAVIGLLLIALPYEAVFVGAAAFTAIGGLITYSLHEPRKGQA